MISTPVRFLTYAGRTTELEHFGERRRAAAAGRGGAVLISGDAGIGKSRFVAECCARLPRRTTRVASAAYREFAQRPLAPLLALLAQLDPRAAGLLAATPNRSRREYLAAFVDAFERVAAAGTTVAVLEDVHWADREALEIVHALLPTAATRRLLFVITYRDAELTSAHPNYSLIARLLRETAVSLIALAPLAEAEIAGLLQAAVNGRSAPSGVVLAGIGQRSDGNALFAEELLRYALAHLAAGDELAAAAMPLSLHATLLDRLAPASERARALLSAASLSGRRCEVAPALQMAAIEPSRAAQTLQELVTLGILEPCADDAYRFRHALLRDVVYNAIDRDERRALHERIAQIMLARGDADPETLAHHFWHAGERERAAPEFLRAGEHARAVYAYADAGAWFERAAECFALDGERAAALAAAAQVWAYADRVDHALALYRRAAEIYALAGRIDDVLMTSVLTASLMYESGRASAALETLEETRRSHLAAASPAIAQRFLLRLGFMYSAARRTDRAWNCLEALDAATVERLPALDAERWFLAGGLHAQRSEATEWHRAFERGFTRFEAGGAIPDNLRVALSNAAAQGFHLGESEIALAYAERALAIARTIKSNPDHERFLLAQMRIATGDLAAAHVLLAETGRTERFATRVERAIAEAQIAQLAGDAETGDVLDRSLLAHALSAGTNATIVRLVAAFAPLEIAQGRSAEAAAMLERGASAVDTTFGLTAPIATIARHHPRASRPLRELVAAAAQRPGNRVDRALLDFIDAALADAPERARAQARSAAAGFAALGWALLEAQALELADDCAVAVRMYRAWGASGAVRRLERALPARPASRRDDGILTPRERELLRLVATGDGNRAAAARLAISEKAVEKHLTSIYGKLGLTSRAQLAVYVANARR